MVPFWTLSLLSNHPKIQVGSSIIAVLVLVHPNILSTFNINAQQLQ
jgi:hypothetical protein